MAEGGCCCCRCCCCCACEVKFKDITQLYSCLGCRWRFCASQDVNEGDRVIKACHVCYKKSKRHIQKIYPSFQEDGSLVKCDDKPEESDRQTFSSATDNQQYSSDIGISNDSFRNEYCSSESRGSNPLDSSSRFNINTPRDGHSVQNTESGSTMPKNGCSSSPDMMAVLERHHKGTNYPEHLGGRLDKCTISANHNDKLAKPLDFENNVLIWVPPPSEDDEAGRNYFDYDDDDDDDDNEDNVAVSGGLFSSSSSLTNFFPSKENHHELQKQPLKTVIHGHFRALVSQLLHGEGIMTGNEDESHDWLDIVSALAWQAANFVSPDTSKGGSMDPGSYVKIKCVASGNPFESTLVKGVVCTKNITHKRMTSQYKSPRILLLGGSLEYQRAQNQLASLNTLLDEEMNHLKMIVSKIEAHRPNVLLVEKSVSSYAQEYLLTKEISLVLNVKRPLLERIARCTGASITPVNNISHSRLGHCKFFRLEKVSEVHEIANQFNKKPSKNLMYFEGCPKRLGCTVLLKGSCRDELKKIKHVLQYAVFAAYHLSLETSFLADEGAHLPKRMQKPSHYLEDNTSTNNAISNFPSSDAVTISQDTTDEVAPLAAITSSEDFKREVCPALFNSASTASLNDRPDTRMAHDNQDDPNCNTAELESPEPDINSLGLTEFSGDVSSGQSKSLEAMFPVEGQLRRVEMFDDNDVPSDYLAATDNQQNILVSYSSRCVSKGTLCERSRLLRIRFYGSFDKPLGRYLRDDLFDQASVCRSCKEPVEAHVQCYTHRQGVLSINVRRLDMPRLPGEHDGKVWMWHRCLRCEQIDNVPPSTRRIIMSDAAWGLSFGKFLELSFSNHMTANRVASCGHSLQRDCLRFYGFGCMVAFFHYSPIDILNVQLPSSMLEFNGHTKQDWIQREVEELQSKTETLYSEVANVLHVMEQKSTSLCNNSADCSDLCKHILELKDQLDMEKNKYYGLLQQAMEDNSQSADPSVDIFELNRLRRSLVMGSRTWDRELYSLDTLINSKSFKFEGIENAGSHAELKEVNKNYIKDSESGVHQYENFPRYTDTRLSECFSSDNNHFFVEEVYGERETTVSDDSSESVQSRAFSLSDKIDSAWTGTDVDVSQDDLASHVDQVDNREIKRLMAPARVYSFDSATRLQEKIHKKLLTSSHLSAVRSFHGSTDHTRRVMRTCSQFSTHDLQFTPSCISSVSHLTGGPRLLLPQVWSDLVIAVYDDEPTTVISYALSSKEYEEWVLGNSTQRDGNWSSTGITREDSTASTFLSWPSLGSLELDHIGYGSYGSEDTSSRHNTASTDHKRSPHLQISFGDDSPVSGGKAKFSTTCYFAKQFDMVRQKCCPSKVDFVRSLSRCKRWTAQGGKSNVYFAKSMDERFIIKQVTKTELDSFREFAVDYFKYLNDSLDSGSPTCLAKVLGIFQVTIKNLKGGRDTRMDLMVMENLFFNRRISRVYDLKGSLRSRYNPDQTGASKVLLDMNLLETLRTNPIFLGSKAKRRLERAVWNDTSFLASVDVMDYSLLVGVDVDRKELVVGIIDFMRQYTWDKHLETWVKASGILGGPKNASPTIISPKQYKRRFRKAMTTYFLTVPEEW
ncbi:hypothetical protein vseg_019828 [Gypsophila vaccaria]